MNVFVADTPLAVGGQLLPWLLLRLGWLPRSCYRVAALTAHVALLTTCGKVSKKTEGCLTGPWGPPQGWGPFLPRGVLLAADKACDDVIPAVMRAVHRRHKLVASGLGVEAAEAAA